MVVLLVIDSGGADGGRWVVVVVLEPMVEGYFHLLKYLTAPLLVLLEGKTTKVI